RGARVRAVIGGPGRETTGTLGGASLQTQADAIPFATQHTNGKPAPCNPCLDGRPEVWIEVRPPRDDGRARSGLEHRGHLEREELPAAQRAESPQRHRWRHLPHRLIHAGVAPPPDASPILVGPLWHFLGTSPAKVR